MRDVSKILSDAEVVKLRALLAGTPDQPITEHDFQEYPKTLFHRNFIELYRIVKSHPDPIVKKEAQGKFGAVTVLVWDITEEEDYIADGWKSDPNEFLIMAKEDGGLGETDSRIPIGREGRRQAKMNVATREQELREIRRRYAELTGKRLVDDEATTQPETEMVTAPLVTPDPVSTAHKPTGKPATVPATKRERVAAAARSASTPHKAHSAHA